MNFSQENNGWEYEWLCVLDQRCGRGDGDHSVHCVEMNADREEKLWDQERKERMEAYRGWGIFHR